MRFNATANNAGFTLVEVLAALVFMAIVIPLAIAAIHVASTAGVVAERKAVAARIADRVLNEAAVTESSGAMAQNGTVVEDGKPFHWTLSNEAWPVVMSSTSSMQVLTADVAFSAQGRNFDVKLSTLVNAQ